MSVKQSKKKLCWNCEGSASLEDENCPFCGVYLSPISIPGNSASRALNPPYNSEAAEELSSTSAPYKIDLQDQFKTDKKAQESQGQDEAKVFSKTVIFTILLLTLGICLFLLGFAMLLFSQDGVFTLRWDGDFWPLYLLLSIPTLFIGSYLLERVKD